VCQDRDAVSVRLDKSRESDLRWSLARLSAAHLRVSIGCVTAVALPRRGGGDYAEEEDDMDVVEVVDEPAMALVGAGPSILQDTLRALVGEPPEITFDNAVSRGSQVGLFLLSR
jgi:hypothetical protein